MSKILNKPVSVVTQKGAILRIRYGKTLLKVMTTSNRWRESGRWWRGEEEKEFYQVETDKGVYIVYRENRGNRWILYKSMD